MLQFYYIVMLLDVHCSRMCQDLGVVEVCLAPTRQIVLCVTDGETLLCPLR